MQNSNPSSQRTPPAERLGRTSLVKQSSEGKLSDIELVVRATKELRQRLVTDLGAIGLTLHECLDSLAGRLPDEEVRRLRFIATIRNKLINEVGVDTLDNRSGFIAAYEQADAGITIQVAAWRLEAARQSASINPTATASESRKAGCFIATAVYPDPESPQLVALRTFRDEQLLSNAAGRLFVSAYYWISPVLAERLRKMPNTSAKVRRVLNWWLAR